MMIEGLIKVMRFDSFNDALVKLAKFLAKLLMEKKDGGEGARSGWVLTTGRTTGLWILQHTQKSRALYDCRAVEI
jgi:hypothetical protein